MTDTLTYLKSRLAYITQGAKRGDEQCRRIIIAHKIYLMDKSDINKQRLIDLVEEYRSALSFPAVGGR